MDNDFQVAMKRPQYGPNRSEFERLTGQWQTIAMQFHRLTYSSEVWREDVRWRGVKISKLPSDLWIYQELIYELQPDLLIETGTASGGSALFFATLLDLNQRGQLVSIDHDAITALPAHPRVAYWRGSSTDPAIIERLAPLVERAGSVMVTLDSAHSTEHVRRELELYSPLVTIGSYIVVEDGNVDGHPVQPGFVDPYDGKRGGPQAAIRDFLSSTDKFEIDQTRHKFFVTFNPNGYLRRVR